MLIPDKVSHEEKDLDGDAQHLVDLSYSKENHHV